MHGVAKGLQPGTGRQVGIARREAAGVGKRGRDLKKTHNRVGRFAAAFESIQRQLQLETSSHRAEQGCSILFHSLSVSVLFLLLFLFTYGFVFVLRPASRIISCVRNPAVT